MDFLEDSYYHALEERVGQGGGGGLAGRVSDLEDWRDSPVENAGPHIPTDLSTNLIFALLANIGPSMNATNARVNALAVRVNVLQDCYIDKGLMAA